MKTAPIQTLGEQRAFLAEIPVPEDLRWEPTREGWGTLVHQGIYWHSRYRPVQEAERLLEGLANPGAVERAVVLGGGLGYLPAALLGFCRRVLIIEPDPAVAAMLARHAPESLDCAGLWTGSLHNLLDAPNLADWIDDQTLSISHPPTERAWPDTAEEFDNLTAAVSLSGKRLNIAVVGPMYGGSAPLTGYLARAFRDLGHRVMPVLNEAGWPLYEAVRSSLKQPLNVNRIGQVIIQALNDWTLARVGEFNPEICIVMAQAPVRETFPVLLRQAGIVTAYWFVENWRHMPYWKDIAPLYDGFFHIQPGDFEHQLRRIGCPHNRFVQTGCCPHAHRPVTLRDEEQELYDCDISFAGAGYPNRLEFFKGLTDYRFKIWGVNWNTPELARLMPEGEGRFDNEKFMKIVAGSRINLNLHSSNTHAGVDPDSDAINPRVFEIAAAGGFQVCDPCRGLDQHFDLDREIPAYRTLSELREKIDYYLAHEEERRATAERARQRALAEHTYAHRAKSMLRHLFLWHGNRMLERGVREQYSAREAAARCRKTFPELAEWLESLPEQTLFIPEEIEPLVPAGGLGALKPATRVLAYLKEVRSVSELLLKEHR